MRSPFETRSKYFKNPNKGFAKAFSNTTVVIIVMLILIVGGLWGLNFIADLILGPPFSPSFLNFLYQ